MDAPVKCETCEDSGYVWSEVGQGYAPCECEKERRAAELLKACGVPEVHAGKSFKAYTPLDAWQKQIHTSISKWLNAYKPDEACKGFWLIGKEGSGKSLLASMLCRAMLAKRASVKFVNVPRLYIELRDSMRAGSKESERDLLDELSGVRFLVLDDVAASKPTEYASDILYCLLNDRCNNGNPTVVTSNMGKETIGQFIGTRSLSRLKDLCHPLMFAAVDYRENKAAVFAAEVKAELVDDGKGSTVTRIADPKLSGMANIVANISPVIKKGAE